MVMSRPTAYPATHASASVRDTRSAVRPMTTASSTSWAIGRAHDDALGGADERARRLQEDAGALDRERVARIVVVQLLVGPDLGEVLLVVHRRRHELARIGDGAEERQPVERQQRRGDGE